MPLASVPTLSSRLSAEILGFQALFLGDVIARNQNGLGFSTGVQQHAPTAVEIALPAFGGAQSQNSRPGAARRHLLQSGPQVQLRAQTATLPANPPQHAIEFLSGQFLGGRIHELQAAFHVPNNDGIVSFPEQSGLLPDVVFRPFAPGNVYVAARTSAADGKAAAPA